MNLDVSAPLVGIAVLNVIALVLLVAVEIRARRARPEEPAPRQEGIPSTPGLDRWIEEIEEVEQRHAFASGGDFLPRQNSAVNG